jgi:plastocyanin
VLLALACAQEGDVPHDVVQLDDGVVQLPAGARRHDVRLVGVDASREVEGASVTAHAGDAVAFTAGDAITHSIVFLADRLDSAQVAFLETSGQMRGPPLLAEGSAWVVSFDAAPPGDYPFACTLHGGRGVVHVGAARGD